MSTPAPELHSLDNGIQIVAESMAGAQSLVVGFRFTFGAKDDPEDRLGLAYITEDTVFKGTPSRDARAIFDAFDSLGIRRGSAASVEYTTFQAQLLPRHFEDTVSLYSEIFRSASFPDDQVEIAKTLSLEELKRLEDNPVQQVMLLTYQAGLGSPLGRNPLGEPGTVSAITPPGVRKYWSSFCKPETLLISVAGGLETSQIFKTLENVFGDWTGDGKEDEQLHHVSVSSRTVHHDKQSEQEHIAMLFEAVPRGHDLYYPGQLAVGVLSGSGSSRLFTEVREKRGLAYSVSAFYRARKGGGLMGLYAGTTADRAQETLDVCRRELTRLGEDVTEEELTRAKTVMKGRLFTTGDLPSGRSGSIQEDLFLEGTARSVDEIAEGIDSVTLDQIPAYLEAYPSDSHTLVTLGPKSLEV